MRPSKCYKPSTVTCRLQEVLMPSTLKPPQRAIQLVLFRPPRNEPNWNVVPIEVQQQVLRLLARMLRDHVARRHSEPVLQGDRDE
jgi:hypothetical protein